MLFFVLLHYVLVAYLLYNYGITTFCWYNNNKLKLLNTYFILKHFSIFPIHQIPKNGIAQMDGHAYRGNAFA